MLSRRTLYSDIDRTFSIPSSSMSMTSLSNVRAKMRLFGRFFECRPTRKSEASFFFDQKASEVLSSNGCMALLLLKEIASGFFSCIYTTQVRGVSRTQRIEPDRRSGLLTNSESATLTASLVDCPLTKIAVFGFSLSFASFFMAARLLRAFFGFDTSCIGASAGFDMTIVGVMR